MRNRIGRNDICPCGSGKKYKKCCMETASIPVDFAWRKLRQLEGIIMDKHLIPYAMETLPKVAVEAAVEDFFLRNYQKK